MLAIYPDRSLCKASAFPHSLAGKRILDVGGYDGAMAKLALDKGAGSAVVVDNRQFRQYEGYPDKATPTGVGFWEGDVLAYNLPAEVVLLYDVAYHCKSPYLLFEAVRRLTKETLCLSTRFVRGDEPVWRLFAPREQHTNDPTVCWKPTLSGLSKLLQIVGFRDNLNTYLEMPGLYEQDGFVVQRWRIA